MVGGEVESFRFDVGLQFRFSFEPNDELFALESRFSTGLDMTVLLFVLNFLWLLEERPKRTSSKRSGSLVKLFGESFSELAAN